MKFTEAQLDFQIRYYRWAIVEAQKEVDGSFPNFWLFKGGLSWQVYQFMRQLSKGEQYVFMSGMLKRTHSNASKALGESLSTEEELFTARFGASWPRQQSPAELDVQARRRAGEKIRFVSKRRLQKAVTATFDKLFKGRFVMQEETAGDLHSYFDTRIAGWNVTTSFWFGRHESLLSYHHSIFGDDLITHPDNPEITAPATVLARSLHWIWKYQMQWELLMTEDVEPACYQVCNLSSQLFAVLPRLLEGLEPGLITRE